MSADMMIISAEDENDTFFVDETSMGEPWNEFGKWFQSRFCGAPGMVEQIMGIKEHTFSLVTESDVVAIESALEKMDCHAGLDKNALVKFMRNHIGKRVSTENW